MIIFEEGLPRSGKSLDVVKNQICPALLNGRSVYAYIEGLNHSKFSEVTGIPLDRVLSLLHQLTKEQVKDIYNHVKDDSLVIIDELQDFFPSSRTPLDSDLTEFVTQHGHRGIDIICMGQDNRDCHSLWKRRIDTLIVFVKRDAIGKPDSYTWTSYKQKDGKFIKLRSGTDDYDSKYFGLYKSHRDGVKSIDAHRDDRSNIFKSSVFTFWLPLFFMVLVFAGYYIYGFFTKAPPVTLPNQQPKTQAIITQPQQPKTPITQQPQAQQPQQDKPILPPEKSSEPVFRAKEYSQFVERYLEENRPRLSALIVSMKTKKLYAQIDFYKDDRVIETFTVQQLEDFGYKVEHKSFGLLISKANKAYPVTMWRLDNQPNVPDRTRPSLQDDSPVIARK